MKILSLLLLLLLGFSASALFLPTQEANAVVSSPNWKPFISCLNGHATCLGITGPVSFFQGLPNSNQTSHYVWTNFGIGFWYNSKGNFSVPYFTGQWGTLSSPCLLIPNGTPTVINASTISQSFKQSLLCGSNTASITVYYKQQIAFGYVSLNLKQAVQHSFSSYPAILNEVFLNPLNKEVTYDSAKHQVSFGNVGYDWSDAPSATFNVSSNTLSWRVGISGVIDPTTIGTSTLATATGYSDQHKVWYQRNGYDWDIYSDGTNCGFRSSADGITWGSFTTLRACAQGYYMSTWIDSSNEFYYCYADASTQSVHYNYGTANNDGTMTLNVEGSFTTTGTAATNCNIFAFDVNHQWITVITTQAAKAHLETWYDLNAGGFANKDDVNSNQGSTLDSIVIGLSTNAKLFTLWAIAGSYNTVNVRFTTNTGASWTAGSSPTNSYNLEYSGATHIGDTLHFAGLYTGGNQGYWNYPVAGSISADAALDTAAVGYSVSISADTGTTIIAAWGTASTTIKYAVSTNSGSSFAAAKTLTSGETAIQGQSMTIDPLISSSTTGLTWTAGNGPNYNVRFSTISLTTSDTITLTVSPVGGTQGTFTLSGGGVSPTTVLGDGTAKSITCNAGNPTVTITVPADGASNLYRFASLATTSTFTCDGTGHSVTYYYMDIVTYQYTVSGGGSPTAPTLTGTALGATTTLTAPSVSPATTYLDHATSYSLTNPTTGSTATERWDSNSASGTSSGGLAINPTYYHQYACTCSYSGSVVSAPSFSRPLFGSVTATALTTTPTTLWGDASGAYTNVNPTANYPSITERYQRNTANGTINAAFTLAPTFYHQFVVTNPNSLTLASPTQFGSASASSTSNVWVDNSGTVTCSCTYSNAWTVTYASWIYDVTQVNIGFQLFGNQAISSIVWQNTNQQSPYLTFSTASSSHIKGFIPSQDGFSFSKVLNNGVMNAAATFTSNILDETGASPHEWDFTTGVINNGGNSGGTSGGSGGGFNCPQGYVLTSSGCMLQSQINPVTPPVSTGATPPDNTGLYTVAIIGTITVFLGIGVASRNNRSGGWRLPDTSPAKRRRPSSSGGRRRQPSNSKPSRRKPSG